MQKTAKRILASILSLAMILPLASCGNAKKSEGEAVGNTAYGQVWSAPSSVKFEQKDIDYANKGPATLTYEAVRNEYESRQLLITADKPVDSFTLEVSDLKNGDEVFASENFTVYVEYFMTYNGYGRSGHMADPLIPQSAAVEHKENKIAKENLGALWVTVYVPKETKAGSYIGTFQLTLDGGEGKETLDVPVSLNVYDYELSDEPTARTLFSWRYNRVAPGELDGSAQMMTTYYEFFKDYRISLQSMPLESLNGEELIAALETYYDEISSYTLLSDVGDVSKSIYAKWDAVREQVLAIASISSTEKNYFGKALLYPTDEPALGNATVRQNLVTQFGQLTECLQTCVDAIAADTTGAYDNFKKIANWESCIMDIPRVVPVVGGASSWLLGAQDTEEGKAILEIFNVLCVYFSEINDTQYEKYKVMCEENGMELWWYGCLAPKAPAPTYHVADTNILSARTVSWLQSKYDVVGNLYWDAAAYTDENTAYKDRYMNMYEGAQRRSGSSFPIGDGNLCYPGAAYGVYGPIPSVRLMSIRDGMEEYELLEALDTILTEKTNIFDEGVSTANIMNNLYNAVSGGIQDMYEDGEKGLDFTSLRSELLGYVAGIDNGLALLISKRNVLGDRAVVTFNVQEGATVTIGDKKLQAVSGNTYECEVDLVKDPYMHVTVANAEGETINYDRFVSNPVDMANSISDASVLEGLKVTNGSTVELAETDSYSTDGTSAHFMVNGVLTGNELIDLTFMPTAKIATSLFGDLQPKDVKTYKMDVYNPGEAFTVNIKLYSGSAYASLGEYEIKTGQTTLEFDMGLQFKKIDTADYFVFEFENATEGGQTFSYEFYIDNIVADI